ncbi:T-cell surface glycoprotein CD8 alpha chain [Taeniopygia guttata]|nr:T-cell surface glycoprotein CD8 alpha chain [Taeniopygia guttata]
MDTAPALLLLLTLGCCCPGIYGQPLQIKVSSPKDITQLRVGQRLELECQTYKRYGASWIRQDKHGTLHFIVFISSVSRASFGENQGTAHRFETSKHNTVYRLVVKSFSPEDEGTYFCVMSLNQMLHFSPGQRAFLPVTTTVAPTTCGPTSKRGTTEEPNLKSPDPEGRMQKDLNFLCHIFIWVPLAGACLLLLIALVITAVLCQQTRRRRCRCKRPANRNPPTKPRTPN